MHFGPILTHCTLKSAQENTRVHSQTTWLTKQILYFVWKVLLHEEIVINLMGFHSSCSSFTAHFQINNLYIKTNWYFDAYNEGVFSSCNALHPILMDCIITVTMTPRTYETSNKNISICFISFCGPLTIIIIIFNNTARGDMILPIDDNGPRAVTCWTDRLPLSFWWCPNFIYFLAPLTTTPRQDLLL